MAKPLIPVEVQKNILLVDSRLITEDMGVVHGKWLSNIIKKYQNEIEEKFWINHF